MRQVMMTLNCSGPQIADATLTQARRINFNAERQCFKMEHGGCFKMEHFIDEVLKISLLEVKRPILNVA